MQRLHDICRLKKPFVIEFSGTPRTGKTSTIHNLYDFFKKGGFKTTIIEEFTGMKKEDKEMENIKKECKKLYMKYYEIIDRIYAGLMKGETP